MSVVASGGCVRGTGAGEIHVELIVGAAKRQADTCRIVSAVINAIGKHCGNSDDIGP